MTRRRAHDPAPEPRRARGRTRPDSARIASVRPDSVRSGSVRGGRSSGRRPGPGRGAARSSGSFRGTPRRARYPLGIALRTALSRRRRLIAAVLLSAAAAIAVLQLSPGSQQTVPTVVAARSLGAGSVLSPEDLRVADYPVALVPADGTAAPSGSESGSGSVGSVPAASADSPVTEPEPGPPSGSSEAEGLVTAWVGRTLAVAVVEGQPLTGPSVLGPDLLAGQAPGTTAVTVRVADAAALTHIRPGQHVDLIRAVDDPLGSAPSEPHEPLEPEDPGSSAGPDRSEDEDSPEGSQDSGGSVPDGSEASLRVAAQLPVLWVADPAAPTEGLLASAPEVQDDLMVVGADAATAERIAAAPEGELVPVLVAAPAEPARTSAPTLSPSAEAAER